MDKENLRDILYQQLQLLAENIEKEEDICKLGNMTCDFRHIAKTILANNPSEEQRKKISEMINRQIELLSQKKSVYLSDVINDLANFAFYYF